MNKHKKAWGYEEWLCNNTLYCAKKLIVQSGWQCSRHYHPRKDETFICESGYGWVCVEGELVELLPGTSVRILPGTWHFFLCPHSEKQPLVILEVSTYHSDEDVVRDPTRLSRQLQRISREVLTEEEPDDMACETMPGV
jgi:mannose-6-phosphate isomerase-like protein (cupin superfamily)